VRAYLPNPGGTGGSSASVFCVFSGPVYRDKAYANRTSSPTTIIAVQTNPHKLARRMNHRGSSQRVLEGGMQFRKISAAVDIDEPPAREPWRTTTILLTIEVMCQRKANNLRTAKLKALSSLFMASGIVASGSRWSRGFCNQTQRSLSQ